MKKKGGLSNCPNEEEGIIAGMKKKGELSK